MCLSSCSNIVSLSFSLYHSLFLSFVIEYHWRIPSCILENINSVTVSVSEPLNWMRNNQALPWSCIFLKQSSFTCPYHIFLEKKRISIFGDCSVMTFATTVLRYWFSLPWSCIFVKSGSDEDFGFDYLLPCNLRVFFLTASLKKKNNHNSLLLLLLPCNLLVFFSLLPPK